MTRYEDVYSNSSLPPPPTKAMLKSPPKSTADNNRLFPLIVPEQSEDNEWIKWKIGDKSYSSYMPLLRSIELRSLLPHVLTFHNKVRTTVFMEEHQGHSLFRQFHRVLAPVVRATWDTVNTDDGEDLPALNERTVEQFDTMLLHFIAAHCTAEDQQELISMIRSLRKPRAMAVQAFWYQLHELNTYIGWLPGNAPSLPDNKI